MLALNFTARLQTFVYNYVIGKVTLDIIKAEMQIIWNCFSSVR